MIYGMDRVLNPVYPKACIGQPTVDQKNPHWIIVLYYIVRLRCQDHSGRCNDANVTISEGPHKDSKDTEVTDYFFQYNTSTLASTGFHGTSVFGFFVTPR